MAGAIGNRRARAPHTTKATPSTTTISSPSTGPSWSDSRGPPTSDRQPDETVDSRRLRVSSDKVRRGEDEARPAQARPGEGRPGSFQELGAEQRRDDGGQTPAGAVRREVRAAAVLRRDPG